MIYTNEQLFEKYEKLPRDVQEAILDINTSGVLQTISKENNLTTEQLGALADETGLLMLGLTHPNNFISNLTQRLAIDKELTRKVAHQVNEQIFSKIRESLRKMYEEEPEQTPTSQIPHTIQPQREFKPEGPEGKDIFEERTQKEIFRSKPEVVEKQYPKGTDPYREPTV